MGKSRKGIRGRRERFGVSPESELKALVVMLQNPILREVVIANKSRQKFYDNDEGEIPEGQYIEMNVTTSNDARRLLLEVNSGELFLTNRHYAPGSFEYVCSVFDEVQNV